MTRARLALPLLLVSLVAADLAQAVEIRVRARTQLTSAVTRTRDGLVVRGRLADDTHRGIAERPITLSIDGWPDAATVQTGPDGELVFHVDNDDLTTILGGEGSRRVSLALAFPGDTRYGAASEERVVHVDKLDVDLSVAVVPSMVVLSEQRDARLLVEAFARGRALPGARVSVRVVGGGPRELTTGPDGRGTALLLADSLPPPGEIAITAQAAETAETNAASARSSFLVVTPTAVTLDVAPVDDAEDPQLRVRGTVTDLQGPIAGAIVTVTSAGLPLALGVSDGEGAFAARIGADSIRSACRAAVERGTSELPELCRTSGAPLALRAVYTPSEPWRRASASPVVDARMPSPPRVPISAYLLTLALAVGLVIGAQVAQSGLVGRLLALLRRPARPARSRSVPTRPEQEPLQSTPLLPGAHDRIVGQVRDPLTDTPVAGAEVVLLDADGERPLCVTDGAGLFETPPLPDGPQRLAVLARGYIPERLTVQMPAARRALRIELTALRAEALRAYKGVVEPLAGAGAWGLRTPRDLLVALEEHPELRADQLRELTLAFEEVYFADRDLDEGTPERMRRLAKSARAGQSEAGG